jgi:hypothetical protein
MIDLIRRLAMEGRVRATLIVPFHEKRQLTLECLPTKWHEDPTHAFVLERQDESFDERNTENAEPIGMSASS